MDNDDTPISFYRLATSFMDYAKLDPHTMNLVLGSLTLEQYEDVAWNFPNVFWEARLKKLVGKCDRGRSYIVYFFDPKTRLSVEFALLARVEYLADDWLAFINKKYDAPLIDTKIYREYAILATRHDLV